MGELRVRQLGHERRTVHRFVPAVAALVLVVTGQPCVADHPLVFVVGENAKRPERFAVGTFDASDAVVQGEALHR